jgi:hypothetical protein
LDVVIDNIGRGILWTHIHRLGFLVVCVEFLTFSCTQKFGAEWKKWFSDSPMLIRKIMQNNFRTSLGVTAVIGGLHGLPIWLYILRHSSVYFSFSLPVACHLITIYGVIGRLLCLNAELWIIYRNLRELLANDTASSIK